jgi:hypothetical protein
MKAVEWLELYDSIGSIQNLLNDPNGCTIPSELSKKWIIACKLSGIANEGNIKVVMQVAKRLSGAGAKGFMTTYVAKSICKQKPSLQSNPAIVEWMGDNLSSLCGRG